MKQLPGVVATRPKDHQPENLLESNRRHLRQKSQNYPELDRQEREKKQVSSFQQGTLKFGRIEI